VACSPSIELLHDIVLRSGLCKCANSLTIWGGQERCFGKCR
jgi:hypothetical protein